MNGFSVIESPVSGTNLIEASAGTGKTYAISIIYLRLIVEKGFTVEDILAVTFTIPATMELRVRIRERLRDAVKVIEGEVITDKTVTGLMKKYTGDAALRQRLNAAVKGFDQASVYTIHSFCRQMLADNAFESGSLFKIEIDNDTMMIERGIADLCRRELYDAPEILVTFFLNNCHPDELAALYSRRPHSPDLRIDPPGPYSGPGDIEKSYNIVIKHYSRLAGIWQAGKGDVAGIFNRDGLLNKKSYSKDSNDEIIELMDEYISGNDPLVSFKKFENFTPAKIRRSVNRGNEYPESPVFDICQSISDAVGEYNSVCKSYLAGFKVRVFEELDRMILQKRSVKPGMSYDDLIRGAHSGLKGAAGRALGERVRGRFKAALIDEFQDTDDLQFEIFNTLFNNDKTILFLIGDPKQAIYRFRGADIFSYIKASQLMKNRYTLPCNWRSRVELIDSVNLVFGRCSRPFVFDEIEFYPVSAGEESQADRFMINGDPAPPFRVWLQGDAERSYDGTRLGRLASEISGLVSRRKGNPYTLEGRGINPGDIAVLVRTRAQGAGVRDALSAYNIPSVSRSEDNIFTTAEAVEMHSVISAIADPSNTRLIFAALSTLVMKGDAAKIRMIREDGPGGGPLLADTVSRFYGYRDLWVASGFMSMFSSFMENESVASWLLSLNGGERVIANINHLAEILHDAGQVNGFSPKELVSWLASAVLSPPGGDEYAIRLERDDEAVNIVTMHACKGLEFPIVYCPYLDRKGRGNDNFIVYHDPEDNNRPVLSLDKNAGDDVKGNKGKEDLAENVRLLYVALTRAKSMCSVMFDPNNEFNKTPAFHIFVKGAGLEGKDRDTLAAAVRSLADESEGNIVFSAGGGARGVKYIAESFSSDEIRAKEFGGTVGGRWVTHSYSSILNNRISREDSTLKDYQFEFHPAKSGGEGIFAFESGARAGLCIHEIFEKTGFTVKDRKQVQENCSAVLSRYRFDEQSAGILAEMFFNTVNTVLDSGSGLRLSMVAESSKLSELEFYFPVEYFDAEKFREAFNNKNINCSRIYKALAGRGSEPGGMMKGFIDLVFEYNGRYYIADWKSNHLGNSYNDYNEGRLAEEMERHNYFLQYYIYSVALDRYLRQRIGPDYDYNRHFGGVYYLFVRGVHPDAEYRNGVFYDMPEKSVIEKLNRFFPGGSK